MAISSLNRLSRPALSADDPSTAASQGPWCANSHWIIYGLRILVYNLYNMGMRAMGLDPPVGFTHEYDYIVIYVPRPYTMLLYTCGEVCV